MLTDKVEYIKRFAPQLGELAQHHLSHDPNILKTSEWYLKILKGVLERNFDFEKNKNPRYLEVACYRLIMGYQLASEYGFESTLFDICDRDLELGRQLAVENGFEDTVDRVAGDFHDLPFADDYFDFAYVSASLHHTLQPENIIAEMMRVLKPGGMFYCQREPCERLFCFYLFNANRPGQHTPMEAKLHERDTLKLFSSPFHGARNADVFERVENDRIPLDYYYKVFAKYGQIVEQVLYHEGLLTRLDKEILEHEELPVNDLTDFIYEKLLVEVEIMDAHIGFRERLLGYKIPSKVAVMAMARRVAAALKARPEDKSSMLWRKHMVQIFGGNLRFLVRRNDPDSESNGNPSVHYKPTNNNSNKLANLFQAKKPSENPITNDIKYRRHCEQVDSVKYDDEVYRHSALQFWNKLLPDIQSAKPEELFKAAFIDDDWKYVRSKFALMKSDTYSPGLRLSINTPVVLVMRYRITLDEQLIAANLHVQMGGNSLTDVFIPQTEDRILRIYCENPQTDLKFGLTDLTGNPVSADSRITVSVLQCIPVSKTSN